jgi:DNA-binding response OmpR family regulator
MRNTDVTPTYYALRTVEKATVILAANTDSDADVSRLLKPAIELKVLGPVGALAALRLCSDELPAAIVIQRDLRNVNGVELCRLLRGRKRTELVPILIFDSRHTDQDPFAISEANDYVPSAQLPDLVERVRALLQTKREALSSSSEKPVWMYEGRHLTANFVRVAVNVDGGQVDLTRRELGLLRFLVSHKNHVISRKDLLLNVWAGENDGRSRTIDVHIRRLRAKLGAAGDQIQTLPGVGYRFTEQ